MITSTLQPAWTASKPSSGSASPTVQRFWGTKDFYLEDPDGYIICCGGRPTTGKQGDGPDQA
jgi:hypothetical protein